MPSKKNFLVTHEIGRTFMDKRLFEEVGIELIAHRSLSRRVFEISPEVVMERFALLVHKISNKRPSSEASTLQLIESTTIPLNRTLFPWANFRQTKSGIKLHLNICYLDKDNPHSEKFTITHAEENNRNQFELLINKAETTYVIDRGSFDYNLLDRLNNDACFFVTRTNSNIQIAVLKK